MAELMVWGSRSASCSQVPSDTAPTARVRAGSATEAVARHWAQRDETACGDFLTWFDDADRLRGSLARLIHAASDDIAFVPSTAHALAQIVVGLGLYDAPCDANVVTLQSDFPNQLYLPNLREVPWLSFYDAIDANTRLIAISEVNYATGFRPPLAEISRFVAAIPESRRPVLYVDGTQSVGALQFSAQATPVDVYAVHAYKWLISPNGARFFFIAPYLRERIRPNVVGWRSHRDWRNVDNLHHGTPVFKEPAEKYEGGFLPIALLYAMEASVDLILAIGPAEIERRVLSLAADLHTRLIRLGAELDTENVNSQIVTARFPGADASQLAKELARRRVLVSARQGRLRVSPHFYNNEEDLARLESELRSIL